MAATEFPAFIRPVFEGGNAFAEFKRDAAGAADEARRSFRGAMSDIEKYTREALARPMNSAGALDLGVPQMRQAAQAAEVHAAALRQVADAAGRLAAKQGELSGAEQVAYASAVKAADAAEQHAQKLREQVAVYDQLQTELNATARVQALAAGSGNQLAAAHIAGAKGLNANRIAMVGVGQQLTDIAVGFQSGQRTGTIFAQQLPQIAFALSGLEGRVGSVARFLAGPWGAALLIGGVALGALLSKGKETEDQLKKLVDAADSFGEAQSNLSKVIDLTTGALKTQNAVLIEAVRLQAQLRLEQANTKLRSLTGGDLETLTPARTGSTGGMGGIGGGNIDAAIAAANLAAGPRLRAIMGDLSAAAGNDQLAQLKPSEYAAAVGKAVSAAIAQVEKLARGGKVAGENLSEVKQRIIEIGTAATDKAAAIESLGVLAGGPVPKDLKPYARAKDRTDQIADLESWARDAADRIDAIAGRFADAPKAVETARKALADLAALMRKIDDQQAKSKKIGGGGLDNYAALVRSIGQAEIDVRAGLIRQLAEPFRETPTVIERAKEALAALAATEKSLNRGMPDYAARMADIAKARRVVNEAVLRPMADMDRAAERSAQIQSLLIAGKQEEAEVQRAINALLDQYHVKTEAELDALRAQAGFHDTIREHVTAQVAQVRELGRAYEAVQARIQPYLTALGNIRQTIAGSINDALSGKPYQGAANLVKGVQAQFNSLLAETLTNKLFDGIFRDLRDQVTGANPVKAAGERMARTMDGAGTSVTRLTETMTTAATNAQAAANAFASVPQIIAGTAGNDSPLPTSPTGKLPVSGRISKGGTYADHLARGSHGLDIAAAAGTLIQAPAGGKVVTVGKDPRSGNFVIIDHGGGIISSYSHLLQPSNLARGAIVSAGSVIGKVGATGNATGNHLHYRVRVRGTDVDPARFVFPSLGNQAATASSNLKSLAATIAGLADTAGDTGEEIVVTGKRFKDIGVDVEKLAGLKKGSDATQRLSPAELLNRAGEQFGGRLGEKLAGPAGKLIGQAIGKHVGDALQGAAYGQTAAGLVFGGKSNRTGAALGGALGEVVGKKLGETFGKQLGKLSSFAGPLGSIAGGLLGSALGSALTVTKKGVATLAVDAAGNLKVSSITGNSAKFRTAAGNSADSAISTIQRIAEQLGATILPGVGSVSIGVRDGKYRVDPTGSGKTKLKKGAIDFGDDAAAAVKAATLDLIKDGILGGLRAGTQRLLQGSKDLDTAVEKATRFESVFTRLKEHLDPVGAAIDALNKEFTSLKALFAEAGASAEEYAQLQQLYDIERKEAIENARKSDLSALQSLLDDLTINNDAYSLRDRLAAARAKYDPLAADLAAGKAVDFDAFAEAGRNVQEIMRQLEGSQPAYFEFIDQLKALTQKALDAGNADNANGPDYSGYPSPFSSPAAAAEQTVSAIDRLGAYVVGGLGDIISDQVGGQLAAVNDNLGALIRQGALRSNDLSVMDRYNF